MPKAKKKIKKIKRAKKIARKPRKGGRTKPRVLRGKRGKKAAHGKRGRRKRIIREVSQKQIVLGDKLEELAKKGETRGFLTYAEVLQVFPEIEKDIEDGKKAKIYNSRCI